MIPLVLYDIPSKLPGKCWSPNPARSRFVLSYKNLPFDTVWVEYPDIELKLAEVGAPTNKLRDGRELYTIPVLSDPNTGAVLTGSWAIAEYLDRIYPVKPIFPPGSKGLISAFDSALVAMGGDSFRLALLRTTEILNERSLNYFIRTRTIAYGETVDEWSPEGPMRDAHWATIERFYSSAKTWYDRVEGKWLMGDTFSYADIVLAVRSLFLKRVYRYEEWRRIASMHDGMWERLLADVIKECNIA